MHVLILAAAALLTPAPLAFAMSDSQTQQLGGIAIALIGAAGLVVTESVKTRRAANAAHEAATEAVELSRPTGNGFAADIAQRLARIEAAQRGIRSDVADVRDLVTDHLQAHASSDVARH